MESTHLVEESISDVANCMTRFGEANRRVALILHPQNKACCGCCTHVSIPSGSMVIIHKFGKDPDRENWADYGGRCLFCARVAFCLNPQACTYNVPVKSCPTADNVMVDCDLTLLFCFNPSASKAQVVKRFAYTLGAHRFAEYLAAATEEAIRQLVRSVRYDEVYSLCGDNQQMIPMLKTLHEKFSYFGVIFKSAVITDVVYHGDLKRTLQATTEFKSKYEKEVMSHESAMKGIEHDIELKREELNKKNERELQEIQAKVQRTQTNKEKQEVEARALKATKTTEAQQQADVLLIRAETELEVASQIGEKVKAEKTADAQTQANQLKIRTDQECRDMLIESEAAVIEAESIAQAITIDANAEADASEALKVRRIHELKMAKAEVLEVMSRRAQIVISGKNGDDLIESLLAQSL